MLHTRDTNNNKCQKIAKFSNQHYHIQDIKNVQHKNSNISWYHRKFPRYPVDADNFEIIGRNTIILHYHYRLYTNLVKYVCGICWIPCAFPAYVNQLEKYRYPNYVPST